MRHFHPLHCICTVSRGVLWIRNLECTTSDVYWIQPLPWRLTLHHSVHLHTGESQQHLTQSLTSFLCYLSLASHPRAFLLTWMNRHYKASLRPPVCAHQACEGVNTSWNEFWPDHEWCCINSQLKQTIWDEVYAASQKIIPQHQIAILRGTSSISTIVLAFPLALSPSSFCFLLLLSDFTS